VAARSRVDLYFIDSTIVKAHCCASGGKGGRKKRAIGISRGGRTTAVADSKGRPLNFTVTGGQVHDSQVVEEVLNTPRPPLAVSVDKAYDSKEMRQGIKDEGALPVIPSRSNATKKAYCPTRGCTEPVSPARCTCIGSPPLGFGGEAVTWPRV
jgi:hypothetical protein